MTSQEMERPQFSVSVVGPDGAGATLVRHLDADTAGHWARRVMRSIDAQLGLIEYILITDSAGHCSWAWHARRGVLP
jgi:hypothetical protein